MSTISLDKLAKWLPRVRWWPYPTADNIDIHEKWIEDNILFLIIEYHGEKYYLPLCMNNKPDYLPEERVLHVDNKVFYEAEFSPKYLSVLDKTSNINAEYYDGKGIASSIKSVYPVTFETTNVVVIHEGIKRIFVKSYRRLSKSNPEPRFFDLLTRKKYKYVPHLYAMYLWRDIPITLVMEYVPGESDGGKPFYDALMEKLQGKSNGLRIGLASLLGTEIAELHRVIAESNEDFFRPEEVTVSDVRKWVSSLQNLYKNSIDNLEKLSSIEEYKYVDYWLNIFNKIAPLLLEETIQFLEKQIGLKKMRIHNDLHLAQFIYNKERGFILTDFEGEPGRRDEDRLLKIPVFRDIASMIRSFQYLAFFGLVEYTGLSIDELGRRLVSTQNDPTIEWRNIHLRALITSYIADIAPLSSLITGIESSRVLGLFNKHVIPWIIERGFYEVFYESSYGRNLIPVPIVGLHEIYLSLRKKHVGGVGA